MTEIEAWEFCAKVFEGKVEWGAVEFDGRKFFGLCEVLNALRGSCKIDFEHYYTMKDVISDAVSNMDHSSAYLFPCTPEGALLRVAFCRAQIERLKKEGNNGEKEEGEGGAGQ